VGDAILVKKHQRKEFDVETISLSQAYLHVAKAYHDSDGYMPQVRTGFLMLCKNTLLGYGKTRLQLVFVVLDRWSFSKVLLLASD
jgi:hypothetical protein